ncbi:hypothetical protein BN7_4815 [Wickerhamomyces ciferrii]|uniref:Uncharacterized protein n=1 Tax=Wickerhamomyces ciferrii (strain ATCC 14091 / BCRC 22168 / CBS 111 / JCM 3599 / NBRC 0793 / NRRL Y-1031 F-60-10) TaxID=1206466 RepID=K0KUX8_WICCF|nr:uncharacterized protein BN7_4815 [Wickerhamomyces ciferrii]CCH45234.1 hypothetical protein BN7_4815 [Wickerhamomyces ciferrii]
MFMFINETDALLERILGYSKDPQSSILVHKIGDHIKDTCQVIINTPISTTLDLNSPKREQVLALLNLPTSVSDAKDQIDGDCIQEIQYENNFTILKVSDHGSRSITCAKGIKLLTKFIGDTISPIEMIQLCDNMIDLFPQFFAINNYNLYNSRSVVFLLLQESFYQVQTRACAIIRNQQNFCCDNNKVSINYEHGITSKMNQCLKKLITPFENLNHLYFEGQAGKRNKKYMKLFGSLQEESIYLGIIEGVESKRSDLFKTDIDEFTDNNADFQVFNIFKKTFESLQIENIQDQLEELVRLEAIGFFSKKVTTNGIYYSSTMGSMKIKSLQHKHRIPSIIMHILITKTFEENPSILKPGSTVNPL